MDDDKSENRWEGVQRLKFIEYQLFWEGHVNRSNLMKQFGVSVNTVNQSSIVGAIRGSEAVEVKYQSLSHPEPRWRWISPQAKRFAGCRWHIRAFCLADHAFKDLLLSRIIQTRGIQDNDVAVANDKACQEYFTLEIGHHPALSDTQEKVIALYYGMRGGKAKIKVRQALLYYALKRPGLDTDTSVRRPQEQQIFLINRDVLLGNNSVGHVL